jgi:hypothetical protein
MENLFTDNRFCKYFKENFYAQFKKPENCEIINVFMNTLLFESGCKE